MFVEIRNPYAVELCDYRLVETQRSGDGFSLRFEMNRREGGNMDWMLHATRPRYLASDWTARPRPATDTELRLELQPVTRELDGLAYRGFSYVYHYRSGGIPIYKILDRGTWEPGGGAVGNQFWMRNCFTPSIAKIESVEQTHSTEWYLPDCTNPNVFQFLPFQTELQGFTFTTAEAGTLFTWVRGVAHVRSLFQKPYDINEIEHWHEHCADLAHEFSTRPVEVLFAPGALDSVARANAYESVRELVHETLHAELGMRRERIGTYGQIEEWGNADLERYRKEGLPKLLEAGMKTVYVANHFENNMNTFGVSNMCCTVDYKVAETVGADKLTAFCDDAKAGGTQVEMWGNTSISTLTYIFDMRSGYAGRIRFLPKEGSIMEALAHAKVPFVRNPANAIEADHYTPVFAVLNLRDDVVRDYWNKSWRAAHDEIGLAGIFLDSSFNLSSDTFHYEANTEAHLGGATADQTHLLGAYRPRQDAPAAILSQYRAHLDLMAEMQRYGYRYCNEDLGVFGVHRHGPDLAGRLDNLWMWSECIVDFNIFKLREAGADPDDIFFRGLAYRMMWCLHWHKEANEISFNYDNAGREEDRPTPWHLALWRAFNEVGAAMTKRRILPNEEGVVYSENGRKIVWAFTDFPLCLPTPHRVKDILTGETQISEQPSLRRHHVYEIGKRIP